MAMPLGNHAADPTAPVLRLTEVSAGYGPLVILDGVSIALHPGEIVLVLGTNGSGKSTLLKTVMGLTRVTAGSVDLHGRPIGRLPSHQRAALGLGYVPQTGNVFPDLTVMDNLRMGAFLRKDGPDPALPAVLDLFPRLGERLTARAGELSGGERRMLSIALALMVEPDVLLLDEPSSDLSPAMVDQVYAAIARIHRDRGIPILLVEQNIAMGLSIATRVVVMVRGCAAAEMPIGDVDAGALHGLFLDGLRTGARDVGTE